MTYYQELGVARDADGEALKRAYRRQAKKYHPDRNPNDPNAAKKFNKILHIYRTLSDPALRARYDEKLARSTQNTVNAAADITHLHSYTSSNDTAWRDDGPCDFEPRDPKTDTDVATPNTVDFNARVRHIISSLVWNFSGILIVGVLLIFHEPILRLFGSRIALTSGNQDESRIHTQTNGSVTQEGEGGIEAKVDPPSAVLAKAPSALGKQIDEAERLHGLGKEFLRKGDLDKAITMFSAALVFDDMHIKSYVQRSVALLGKQDLDKAVADCTEAIRRDPRSGEAYFQRGEVYMYKHDYSKVLADFTNAILLNEKSKYRDSRGWLYYLMGRREESMADFNRALEMNPRQSYSYFHRAFLYARQGDLDRSLADYDEAIRLDPRHGDSYFWRSRLYQTMGKATYADADRRKALEIDPSLVRFDGPIRD